MNITQQRGFTLIEVMVGITVLAVLLGLGVPSFTEMVRNNRLVAQTNELVGALNYARSEALKQGFRVSVCPANGDVCSAANNWNTGILVFTDDTGTFGVLDGTDTILQRWPNSTNNFVVGGAGSPAVITFLPTGAELPASTVALNVYKSGCTGQNQRRVTVANTGRIGLTKEACP